MFDAWRASCFSNSVFEGGFPFFPYFYFGAPPPLSVLPQPTVYSHISWIFRCSYFLQWDFEHRIILPPPALNCWTIFTFLDFSLFFGPHITSLLSPFSYCPSRCALHLRSVQTLQLSTLPFILFWSCDSLRMILIPTICLWILFEALLLAPPNLANFCPSPV